MMRKDLRELAKKYESLSETEKMDLQIQAHGQVTRDWFLNRAEEIDNLMNCSWFYVDKLGVEVGGDGRLRLEEGVITKLPEDETTANLQSASDLISVYFTIVVKLLENPELIESGHPNQDDSGDWGEEEFLIGLLDKRRGGDFG